MRYAIPTTEFITDGTYSFEVFQKPTSITGIDDEYTEYDSSTTYNTGDFVKIGKVKASL